MDTRIALQSGTLLELSNMDDSVDLYTIQNEIGRGGSCIVYDASYADNAGNLKTVRIKECYPFKLRIVREESGRLLPIESDASDFEQCKNRMKGAFAINNELFGTDGLTNSVSNTINIYSGNNTYYIVSVYLQGETLSSYQPDSLKKGISIVKSTAKAIHKMHEKGYLYLDVKPQNVFVLDGTTEIVQLFDFDSLVPMRGRKREERFGGRTADDFADEMNTEYRISYTRGFAALEQQIGNFKKIGAYTDVYGVGALLFYLLFGAAPCAPDCESDAEYDFSASGFAHQEYQDRLYTLLTDFFHHTLAGFYADRYQDLKQVIAKLDELEKYADTAVPYIWSTQVRCPAVLVGRENELEQIEAWFEQKKTNCLFLTGMGGIGKSTLMRSYIAANRSRFDTVLYLYYNESMQRTIADDEQVRINTVEKMEAESQTEYFYRKLRVMRELVAGKRAVLVVDNFDNEADADFQAVLNADWDVVAVTRHHVSAQSYDTLNLKAISDRKSLYLLFEKYHAFESGRVQSKARQDYVYLDNIIDKVSGHTLALELIARQVANSYLSIAEASELVDQYGFSNIAPEKVDFVKDEAIRHETIANIITALFDIGRLNADKRLILKMFSLFSIQEMDIHVFTQLLGLDSKETVNQLRREGWMNAEGRRLSIHPVIRESIRQWEWTEEWTASVLRIMDRICRVIARKDYQLSYFIQLAEAVLEGCKNESVLQKSEMYWEFLYQTVIHMPRDREKHILDYADAWFSKQTYADAAAVLNLYDYVAFIYEEKKDYEAAYEKIREAEAYVKKNSDCYAWGKYYEMLAQLYDDKIEGQYDSECSKNDRRLCIEALDKAVHYMKKSENADSSRLCARYMISKAILLIRCGKNKKIEIRRLLHSVKKILDGRAQQCTKEKSAYYMCVAWYYTYIEQDAQGADAFIGKACRLARHLYGPGLELIDEILVPCANMYAELQMYDRAAAYIQRGIRICEEKTGVIPYMRKKMDLYGCLADVYALEGNLSKK